MVKRDKVKQVYEQIIASNSDARSLSLKEPHYKKLLMNFLKNSENLSEAYKFFVNASKEEIKETLKN